jgi:hypothetical protein
MSSIKAPGLLVLFILASGCYTTTLRSGKPAGEPAPDADGHWHSGILTGGVDVSGAYDLKQLCPNGWAEIETETSVFNQVVELATLRLYAPQTVSVRCRATTSKW